MAHKEYEGKKGEDNYKPLSLYEKHTKETDHGFGTFATDDNHFFFSYNIEGQSILISETYTTSHGRDNGMASVTKNMIIGKHYKRQTHSNGKHYFNLLAGNNQEIATSRWFNSSGEMEDTIKRLLAGGKGTSTGELIGKEGYVASVKIEAAAITNEPPKVKKPRKKRKKKEPKGEKVYLKNGGYLFNDLTYQTMCSTNEKYYFSFKNPEGKSILMNANVRGFETEADVDNAVKRVLEFGPYENNFEGKTTKNGKYYYYLNDNNGDKVGKSFFFNTTDDMQTAIGLFIGDLKLAETKAPTKKEKIIDDYLACKAYAGEKWFYPFFNAEQEEYYFAYNSPDGNTFLRSEGYTTKKARNNGIESVKTNAPIEKRWTTGSNSDNEHYYALKAGNHQEIARSCYYGSKAEMETAFAWVRGERSILGAGAKMVNDQWWTAFMFRSKAEDDKNAEALKLEKEKASLLAASLAAAAAVKLKADQETETKRIADQKAEAKHIADQEAETKRIADQKAEAKRKADQEAETKRIADQKAEAKRKADQEAETKRIADQKAEAKRKADQEAETKRIANQKAETKRKADQEAEAKRISDENKKKIAAAAIATAATATVLSAKKEVPKKATNTEDPYLHCKEYKGHKVSDHSNKVSLFEKEAKMYFVVYDNEGDVRIRSEGFESKSKRDSGLFKVLKFINKKHNYKQKRQGDQVIHILHDKRGNEIGRSCLQSGKKAFIIPIVAGATVAAAAAAAAVSSPAAVKKAPVKTTPVAATKGVVKEGRKRKGLWWLWLLLLIPLLLFLLRSCDTGCNASKAIVAPIEEATKPIATPTKEAKTTTPVKASVGSNAVVTDKNIEEKDVAAIKEVKAKPKKEVVKPVKKSVPPPPVKVVKKPVKEESLIPGIGVEAGFDIINEHK